MLGRDKQPLPPSLSLSASTPTSDLFSSFQERPADELDPVLLGDRNREPDTARARPARAAGGVAARRLRRLQGHGPPGTLDCPTIRMLHSKRRETKQQLSTT